MAISQEHGILLFAKKQLRAGFSFHDQLLNKKNMFNIVW